MVLVGLDPSSCVLLGCWLSVCVLVRRTFDWGATGSWGPLGVGAGAGVAGVGAGLAAGATAVVGAGSGAGWAGWAW